MQASGDLARAGGRVVVLDLATESARCFVPTVAPLLSVARTVALVVFVPALLRRLAIEHAERDDADLVKAIAVAVGIAAVYVLLRTSAVVGVCGM